MQTYIFWWLCTCIHHMLPTFTTCNFPFIIGNYDFSQRKKTNHFDYQINALEPYDTMKFWIILIMILLLRKTKEGFLWWLHNHFSLWRSPQTRKVLQFFNFINEALMLMNNVVSQLGTPGPKFYLRSSWVESSPIKDCVFPKSY